MVATEHPLKFHGRHDGVRLAGRHTGFFQHVFIFSGKLEQHLAIVNPALDTVQGIQRIFQLSAFTE